MIRLTLVATYTVDFDTSTVNCSCLNVRTNTVGSQDVRVNMVYDAQRMKRALMYFADNVSPDQRVHLCSIIWAFSVPRHILRYPLIL